MSSFWPEEAELAAIPADEPGPDYLHQLKQLLVLVDWAMDQEGISSIARARVVSRVLHGTPTPGDTADRADVEPEPHDLAVVDALADAAPACVRARPTWDMPPING